MSWLAPDRPFAPRAFPFFYGWMILAVATLGVLVSIPGQTMGVSVFTDHLLAATGLSRLGLANTYLVGTVLSGLLLPFGGTLFDRWGARPLALLACGGLALTLCFLTTVDRLAAWLAGALPGVSLLEAAAVVLCVGFTALRFTGQGLLTMSSRNMLAKWFERRRGLASGITGVLINFGFSLAPAVLNGWIGAVGWRGAWLGMAAVVGLGMSAVAWLFFRDNPEECGLRMDGAPAEDDESGRAPAGTPERAARSHTRSEAVRTLAFWLVTGALAIQSMVFTGVTFHIVDIGAEHGMAAGRVVGLFVPVALISAATGFAVGVAADRVRIPRLIAVMTALQTVSFVGMAHLGDPRLLVVGVAAWGLSSGFFGPITTVALPALFGRAQLGAISGVQMSCLVIASALGPSLLAVSREFAGGYGPGFLACCALSLPVFALSFFTRQPRR